MATVLFQHVTKHFGNTVAVEDFNLEIKDKEFVVLVGPSGCGKTTTLRMIAGLESISSGDVYIGDRLINKLPAKDRNIAMVFQNYALYPHMTVFDNMVFSLEMRKRSKEEIKERVQEAAEILGIQGLLLRRPKQLSGGQRQRVALGRAIVRKPGVFLFDEPLSNLDAKLREELRFEIKNLVRRMGITSVYVTHDQAEAMVISDRIAVMDSGNVVQIGNPRDIYQEPANRFVADFIGTMNFMSGEVVAVMDDQSTVSVRTEFSDNLLCATPDSASATLGANVYASIRPEDVEVSTEPPQATENVFKGEIVHKAYLGNFLFFFVSVNDTMIRVQAPHYLAQ